MATDATSLMASAACYTCAPPGQWQLMKLGLLKEILLAANPMADTSATGLMQSAACYACLPPGMWQLIELGLLRQLVDGGGTGGGGGGVLETTGDPEGVVTSNTVPALALDCNTGALYAFCGTAGGNTGWFPLIAA